MVSTMQSRTIVILGVAVATVGLAAFASWNHRRDMAARWERIEAWTQEYGGTTWRSQPGSASLLRPGHILREPLRQATDDIVEANEEAFAHYEKAIALAPSPRPQLLDRQPWQPAFAELASGARCSVVKLAPAGETVGRDSIINFAQRAVELANAALVDAQMMVEEGESERAVNRLVDVATLAIDLQVSCLAIHLMEDRPLLQELLDAFERALIVGARHPDLLLSHADLRRCSAMFERIDTNMSTESIVAREVIHFASSRAGLAGNRHDAVADWLIRRIEVIAELPQLASHAERRRLLVELDGTGVGGMFSNFAIQFDGDTQLLVELRMLRVGIAFLVGDDLPHVVDPQSDTGAVFEAVVDGKQLTLKSRRTTRIFRR